VINKIRINPKLRSVFVATALVLCVYVILPTIVAWTGAFIAASIGVAQRGIHVLSSPATHNYVDNLAVFLGQLTLLIGSGALALWIWGRRADLRVFGEVPRWREILIGVSIGVIDYYCAKKLIFPWLYMARPIGWEWIKSEYGPVGAYHRSYITQIADLFFVSIIYGPLVETLIFVGLLYRRFRLQWGYATSVLLGSVIFAAAHRDELLFLRLFLFGLINFTLYEFRKSLAAPLFHHVTLNALVYGSQLTLFSGLPAK
jgi:membrane protease YdiL (CAAX protease family)